MKPATLLRLYPRTWRERYGEEFIELLKQTGVGWRQVADVGVAASRERLRVATRGGLSAAASHQVARFAGFYSLMWMSVWLLQLLIPDPRVQSIHFRSLDDHRRLVTTFLIGALVGRIVDNWALPDADVAKPHKSTAQVIGAFSTIIAAVATAVLGVVPGAVVQTPIAFCAISTGQWFGRKRGALSAAMMQSGPGRTPPPSSITTLGLSA